jgi:NAD(P)-dependent dehydrogenase (short-subunit alcohol dehydrogenase family)
MEKNSRSGNILFVSSETGDTADIRPYGLTKAAINSFVKGLANIMAPKGIRVNAVAPGITTSDMTGFKADGNLYYADNTTDRVYLPGEVAEVASFLLSDASGCMSGQILVCNNAKTVNPRWK